MSKFVVIVPRDRRSAGRGLLIAGDGNVKLGPVRVLATASAGLARANGNPSCDFRRPFGHTPAGSFVVAGALPPRTDRRARPEERLGALILAPASGNALEALRAGRTRFLLVGGPTDDQGRLRKTNGALRVASPDLAALFVAINAANADGDPLSSVEIEDVETPPWLVGANDAVPSSRAARQIVPKRVRTELGFLAEARPGRRAFVGLALVAMASLGFGCTLGPDGDGAGDGGGGSGGGSGSEWPGDGGSSSSSSGGPVTSDGGVTTSDEGTTEWPGTHDGGTEGTTGGTTGGVTTGGTTTEGVTTGGTTGGVTTGGVTTGGTDTTTGITTGGTGTGTDTTTNVSTGIPTTGTDTTTNVSTGVPTTGTDTTTNTTGTDGTTTGTDGTTTGTDGTGTDGTGTGTDGTGTGTDGTGTGTDGTGTGTDGTGTGTDGTGTGTDSFARHHRRSVPRTPATGEGPGG